MATSQRYRIGEDLKANPAGYLIFEFTKDVIASSAAWLIFHVGYLTSVCCCLALLCCPIYLVSLLAELHPIKWEFRRRIRGNRKICVSVGKERNGHPTTGWSADARRSGLLPLLQSQRVHPPQTPTSAKFHLSSRKHELSLHRMGLLRNDRKMRNKREGIKGRKPRPNNLKLG